jgi:hypothetical protein
MKRQFALIAALTVALSAAPAFAKAGKFDLHRRRQGRQVRHLHRRCQGRQVRHLHRRRQSGKFYTDGAKSFDVYSDGAKL